MDWIPLERHTVTLEDLIMDQRIKGMINQNNILMEAFNNNTLFCEVIWTLCIIYSFYSFQFVALIIFIYYT